MTIQLEVMEETSIPPKHQKPLANFKSLVIFSHARPGQKSKRHSVKEISRHEWSKDTVCGFKNFNLFMPVAAKTA